LSVGCSYHNTFFQKCIQDNNKETSVKRWTDSLFVCKWPCISNK